MNSISFRHYQIIKTAVAKQKFVQDLIQKYGEETIRQDLGLINRYYEQKSLKSIDTLSQEYKELIDGLPLEWLDAKRLIESELLSAPKDPVKEQLLSLGLQESDLVNKDVRAWLEDRYVKNNGKEIHPIDEAVVTIKEYIESKNTLLNKVKADEGLKKELENRGFAEDKLKNPLMLSVDDMVTILGQYKYGGKTTIRTVGVEIRPGENIGKVGEWNIWLPQSQETSAKIAGYDEVTKDPKTDWCTNRTKGSNLFYHYISRGNIASFLFYIIRDNPEDANDWLSIGFVGRKGDISSIKPVFDGQDGGMTVNRDNKGLYETSFRNILGDAWDDVWIAITDKIDELGGENPATLELEKYAKDISLFKKELWNKSKEERGDFSQIILQMNPAKEVEVLASTYCLDPDVCVKKYKNDPAAAPYLGYLGRTLADKNPDLMLLTYSNEEWAKPYINLAAKNWSKSKPGDFLNYAEKEWAKPYIDIAARNFIEKWWATDFLYRFLDKEWAKPYFDMAAKKAAGGENPEHFITQFITKDWAQPHLGVAAKALSEKDPLSFLNFAHFEWARPYIDFAAKKVVKDNPSTFIFRFAEREDFINKFEKNPSFFTSSLPAMDWARPYIDEAIKTMVKFNPHLILSKYKDKDWVKPHIDAAARQCARIDPSRFLKDFSSYEWAKPYIDIAAEKEAKEEPESFLNDYTFGNPWAEPHLESAVKSLLEKKPFKFFGYSDGSYFGFGRELFLSTDRKQRLKDIFGSYKEEAIKRCIEKDPAKFLDEYSNQDWAEPYIREAAESLLKNNPYHYLRFANRNISKYPFLAETFDEIARSEAIRDPYEFIRNHYGVGWAKPYVELAREETEKIENVADRGIERESSSIASNSLIRLAKALNLLGIKKEADYILRLI